ncbi:3'-5' exonuclease-like [Apium graveolens]|uniref:3'-5' exonuclease-like n=1 Tax=Apium graveolens TaxID=4045 RepID=UPI003D7AFADD
MTTKYRVTFQENVIEVTVTNKASAVDEWIRSVRASCHTQTIVGLDCEWKPTFSPILKNKTATLQLCIDSKCLIVQMFYLDCITQSLKAFFSDTNFTFVGVEVQDYALKLMNEYSLSVSKTCDIQALAMTSWPIRFFRKPGLKELANSIVGLYMAKPLDVCRSNWEARKLTLDQVQYASIDAYASFRIGSNLLQGI